ncbi:MAG: FkbM family methyltransferase [Lachnospira sp.]
MKKAIIWGTGVIGNILADSTLLKKKYNIVSFTDSNSKKWQKDFCGYKVIPPEEIRGCDDTIIIALSDSKTSNTLKEQIVNDYEISKEKVLTIELLQRELVDEISASYNECHNEEINSIINKYKTEKFSIYGNYDYKEEPYYQVYREGEDLPFVLFEGKRMYFPRDKRFKSIDGKEYVTNLLGEQGEGSPHLYLRDGECMKENSIIVDAGVCEGNFALRYVDKAKKVYLIEADGKWIEPLEKTFRPFKDKVVLCNKFLGKYDSETSITLDSLVKENIDFLKMDVEGAETDALLGGIDVLRRSNAECSICSYHNKMDERNIKFILEACGYKTSCSEGYMFFVYDPLISSTMDFRRGVVYGSK